MKYRTLGRTGYQVSEVGYGPWGIGRKMWRGGDDKQSLRALHRAADLGLNFLDTALIYGEGHSERLIGQFLKELPARSVYVATKVPPLNLQWPAQGSLREVFPRKHIIASAETSLRNLSVDHLDLLQLHVWSPDWMNENEWYEALTELKKSGKVNFFGVSVNDHKPEEALPLVRSGLIDSVQVIFNIFDQSPLQELFAVCLENNVGVIVRVPFDEGALCGKITPETRFAKKDWRNRYFAGDRKQEIFDRVSRIKELLEPGEETLPELALRFCLHPQAVSTVIPGMRSSHHVDANLRVSGQPPLTSEMLSQLKNHSWEKNFYGS